MYSLFFRRNTTFPYSDHGGGLTSPWHYDSDDTRTRTGWLSNDIVFQSDDMEGGDYDEICRNIEKLMLEGRFFPTVLHRTTLAKQ